MLKHGFIIRRWIKWPKVFNPIFAKDMLHRSTSFFLSVRLSRTIVNAAMSKTDPFFVQGKLSVQNSATVICLRKAKHKSTEPQILATTSFSDLLVSENKTTNQERQRISKATVEGNPFINRFLKDKEGKGMECECSGTDG